MKVFSYFLKSDSCDYYHIMSLNDYSDAIDFMKHEVECEYEGWKNEGYEDEDIPYSEYDKQMLEV